MTCLEPHLLTGQVKVKKIPTRKENLLFSDDPTGIFSSPATYGGFFPNSQQSNDEFPLTLQNPKIKQLHLV